MYADVVIGLSVDKLDRVFCYKLPEEWEEEALSLTGLEVIVPFGRSNRETKAFIIEIKKEADYDISLIKEIIRKSDTGLRVEKNLIELAGWLKSNYGGTMNEALRSVLQIPKKIESKKKRTVLLSVNMDTAAEKLAEYEKKHFTAKARVLKKAIEEKSFDYETFLKKKSVSAKVFEGLIEAELIEIKEEKLYRKPIEIAEKSGKRIELTEEQKAAVKVFKDNHIAGESNSYLLFGVTGSGKTEVYMEMIDHVISEKGQVIFLIPEIALTYQMVERLSARFSDRISIMNSRMSAGERYDQYLRAKEGDIDIIVGPRSALFTPFERLGLIIVDEEHESSYKNSKTPRYNAREAALHRALTEKADIVLGSATPSLEAIKLVSDRKMKLLTLAERAGGAVKPEIETVNLREELKTGNRGIISGRLAELIEDRLNKKEQIMLFINRRGYAGFVSCRSCGEPVLCPHCDISLSVHKPDRLVCHYCGYETKLIKKCIFCGSSRIGTFGLGTERVEEFVKEKFKGARVLRMDSDTTSGKKGHENILRAFKNGEADILIGTQMIVKGHDFEKVTLVGILAADLSLFAGDFRAAERTYQLLVQAAGRAGRGRYPGNVVIQTYKPEHYSIKAAVTGDYKDFYKKEKRFRRLSAYPPEVSLLAVVTAGEDVKRTEKGAEGLKELIFDFIKKESMKKVSFSAPVWGAVPKIKDVYRKIIYLKSPDRENLIKLKDRLEKAIRDGKEFDDLNIQFDFEPEGNL